MSDNHFYEERTIEIPYSAEKVKNIPSVQAELVRILKEKKLTAASAESLTGGMISGRITEVPGASAVFECGICSYSNRIKHQVLGVREETLSRFTEYSPQTAYEMAVGVRRISGAQVGISATGIAGPSGGTDRNPTGTVYIGLSVGDTVRILRLVPTGTPPDRACVREAAVCIALQEALKLVNTEYLSEI